MTQAQLAVELAKLSIAEAEILKATAEYQKAVNSAKSAGDDLASNWEGEARDQFVAEQEKAYRWHMDIIDIVQAFSNALKATAERYRQAEAQIRSIITGG